MGAVATAITGRRVSLGTENEVGILNFKRGPF
jgi:hypothetical protein